jgi:hypothetical protein
VYYRLALVAECPLSVDGNQGDYHMDTACARYHGKAACILYSVTPASTPSVNALGPWFKSSSRDTDSG